MNGIVILIIYALCMISGLSALTILALKKNKANIKLLSETRDIFDNELYPLCKGAKSLDDCELANKVLLEKCVKDDKFVIHRIYISEFNYLKFYLLGKINILKK